MSVFMGHLFNRAVSCEKDPMLGKEDDYFGDK